MAEAVSDLLKGAKAIGAFLGLSEKQARHRIEAGIIPTFKMPGDSSIFARRSSLTAWLAKCEAEAQGKAPVSQAGD